MKTWKIIESFPDYMISNLGKVKSLKYGKERILKSYRDKNNYLKVSLLINRKRKIKFVHVLVYETFNNYKLNDNECVHHKDENKENNKLDNLELMVVSRHHSLHNKGKKFSNDHKINLSKSHIDKNHSEETKRLMSKRQKGENNPNCKITEEQVLSIKLLLYQNKNVQKYQNYLEFQNTVFMI